VRGGGALLMSVGPEFTGETSLALTPLGEIMPALPPETGGAVDGAFRPEVTPVGLRHPVTAELPGLHGTGTPDWGSWYRRIEPIEHHGEALMAAPDGSPLLLLDRVGDPETGGRVAMLLSDQIWLWSRGHQGGGPQAELLRRVAHWLMKQPELEETALTARVADGRLTVERRTTADGPPGTVAVTAPDGSAHKLPLTALRPGRATAGMPARTPGVWQASDGTRTAYAAAGAANPLEFADLRATASLLAPLARASGGSLHWLAPDGAPDLRRTEPGRTAAGGRWIGFERRHDHLVTGIAALPLLPAWAALLLLLGLTVAAWRREAR